VQNNIFDILIVDILIVKFVAGDLGCNISPDPKILRQVT